MCMLQCFNLLGLCLIELRQVGLMAIIDIRLVLVMRIRDFLHMVGKFIFFVRKKLLQLRPLPLQVICFFLKLHRFLLQLFEHLLLESLELGSHLSFLSLVGLVSLLIELSNLMLEGLNSVLEFFDLDFACVNHLVLGL